MPKRILISKSALAIRRIEVSIVPEIRPEIETDTVMIRDVTEVAFRGRPYAGGDEQDVIDRLRAVGR